MVTKVDNRIRRKFKTGEGRYIKITQRVPVTGTPTQQQRALDNINKVLDTLFTRGRLDILKNIANGVVTLTAVRDAADSEQLDSLPSVQTIQPLREHLFTWVDKYDIAENTRAGYRSTLTQLLKFGPEHPVVADLVAVARGEERMLEQMRKSYERAGKNRTFNQARGAVLAYLHDTAGRGDPLYQAVLNTDPLPELKNRRKGNPLSVGQVLDLLEKLDELSRQIFWTLCVTGMNVLEYSNGWEVDGNTVKIHGTKREGRERVIPLIVSDGEIFRLPESGDHFVGRFVIKDGERKYERKEVDRVVIIGRQAWYNNMFRVAIKRASKGQVQPHDARRTFARWLNEAGLFDTHQSAYMGHGARGMTEMYKTPRICSEMLDNDREKLVAYLKSETEKYYEERKKQIQKVG